jgi:hypothetical protein
LRTTLLWILAVALTACPGAPQDGPDGGSDAGIEVTIIPASLAVVPGGSAQLIAEVSGTTSDAVLWSVIEPNAGSIGSSSHTAVYRAPLTEGVFHLKATSVAYPERSATATVVVTAAPNSTLQILPDPVSSSALFSTFEIAPGASQTFTAASYGPAGVSGSALVPVPAARWSIVQGASGGAVTNDGKYTAPSTAGTYHVLATVPDAPTKAALAELTVAPTDRANVVVTPAIASTTRGGQVQLSASASTGPAGFSWYVLGEDAGSVSSSGLYTAPQTRGVYAVEAWLDGSGARAYATVIVD